MSDRSGCREDVRLNLDHADAPPCIPGISPARFSAWIDARQPSARSCPLFLPSALPSFL